MPNQVRPWSVPQMAWSSVLAIALWSAIGFNWFGFGFGWWTQSSANKVSANAVTERLAAICVAQARGSVDFASSLEKFASLPSTWKQREFVESSKWATMPGGTDSLSDVAEICAERLRQS